ncbi:MAG TPA: thioredoxin family protein [Acidimicrobiales bacterium]|nr:thioredoxin family protein [Acidimicrobiales bacterium]
MGAGEAGGSSGLPDGLVAVVKRDCPTCVTVVPVLAELAALGCSVYTQDDPDFPFEGAIDDTGLEVSWALGVETVPTLLRLEGGKESGRVAGWHRGRWEALAGASGLGGGLPDQRPGCGSLTADPEIAALLSLRHRSGTLSARRVELGPLEDELEAMWARGWTDGLPVVPPTEARVLAMLDGTARRPDEVVAVVPPNLVPVTVEKVAINAVMAGCRPEYLPVVLALVEASCTDAFNLHGVLATTFSVGPVAIVNGPAAKAVGINSGVNLLGQGCRANSTIGRALQLVVRNVGGGRPGEVDRATFGNPAKTGLCFAEDEEGSPWEPLAEARGAPAGASAVTVFAGGGVRMVTDQKARTPEALVETFARHVGPGDALLVVSPDHGRLFRDAGWSRSDLASALEALAPRPAAMCNDLLIAYAGGRAGLFSAVMEGWLAGPSGSVPVTVEVRQ